LEVRWESICQAKWLAVSTLCEMLEKSLSAVASQYSAHLVVIVKEEA
jgi:hypothetical protein